MSTASSHDVNCPGKLIRKLKNFTKVHIFVYFDEQTDASINMLSGLQPYSHMCACVCMHVHESSAAFTYHMGKIFNIFTLLFVLEPVWQQDLAKVHGCGNVRLTANQETPVF